MHASSYSFILGIIWSKLPGSRCRLFVLGPGLSNKVHTLMFIIDSIALSRATFGSIVYLFASLRRLRDDVHYYKRCCRFSTLEVKSASFSIAKVVNTVVVRNILGLGGFPGISIPENMFSQVNE